MKVSFDLHLPFKLPVENGHKIASAYTNEEFFVEFNSYQLTTSIEEDELPPITKNATVVNINYITKGKFPNELEHDALLRITVLNSINYINRFLDSIRTCFGLSYIHNITISDLPIFLLINIENEKSLYITQPEDILRMENTLSKEDIMFTLSTMQTFENAPDIYLVEKFFDSAKSHLYKEQFIDAIVDLQTSFEIFIRNTHRLVLLKKGKTKQEIKGISNIPFRNVIEQHLKKYLKVDLNFRTPGFINDWYRKLYLLRNDIVHSGRIDINGNDAYSAYDAYVNARNYICDKLSDNGYLNINGKVDLNLFKINVKGSINHEEVLLRLKEYGLVDEMIELKN